LKIIFFSGFEMPVPTNNNFPVQETGNLPENVAGNTSVQTSGNSPDRATGNTPYHKAGNMPEQLTGNLPKQAAGHSPITTFGHLPNRKPDGEAGLSDEAAGLSEGTTSESRNLDQVICVNHFSIIIYYLFIGNNLKHL
jgi:hypothetical protein